MKNITLHLLKFKSIFILIAFTTILTSCSSYKTASTDDDGIYEIAKNEQKEEKTSKAPEQNLEQKEDSGIKSNKYEKYFKRKAKRLDIQNDEIFTDIDSYVSDSFDEDEELLDRDVSDFYYDNPSWEDTDNTVINVYDYGFYNPYYSWYRPYHSRFHFGFNYFGFGEYYPFYGYNYF